MQALQQEFSLPLEDFCITLSEMISPAHYLVNIELAPGQILECPQAFLASFDRKLQEFTPITKSSSGSGLHPGCGSSLEALLPSASASCKGNSRFSVEMTTLAKPGFLAGLAVGRRLGFWRSESKTLSG